MLAALQRTAADKVWWSSLYNIICFVRNISFLKEGIAIDYKRDKYQLKRLKFVWHLIGWNWYLWRTFKHKDTKHNDQDYLFWPFSFDVPKFKFVGLWGWVTGCITPILNFLCQEYDRVIHNWVPRYIKITIEILPNTRVLEKYLVFACILHDKITFNAIEELHTLW
jgi:hypothetical protein